MDTISQALERIEARARLVLAATLGLALLLPPRALALFPLVAFFVALYFLYAGVVLLYQERFASRLTRLATTTGDAAALLVVILLAPGQPAAFVLFFVYFTLLAGLWRGWWAAGVVSLLASGGYLWAAWESSQAAEAAETLERLPQESWLVGSGLVAAGLLIGAVAQRERRYIERGAVVEQFARLLSLDAHGPVLSQRWLDALCRRYRAGRALLAYRDPQSDRVLLWEFRRDSGGGLCQESDRPPRDARTFLLDAGTLSFLGQNLDSAGGGRWLVGEGGAARLQEKTFELPERFREAFAPRSLASVALAVGGERAARLILLDAEAGAFAPAVLEDLRTLLEGLNPVLANLLTVRSLLGARLDEERDRIVRELHDSVAQALASVQMQLDVFRRLAVQDPARAAEGLARLQTAVRQEQDELRRYLRTLKPVHVPAAELHRWLLAHCAQFQQETGIEVDVMAEPVDSTLPEGVCREVFFILREALHNVRKHAGARHVLVRLRQEDAHLRLLVDDDGRGFPFAGTYSQTALEEQGLAPISIAEHTRALGGALTIDSTPGSGATLRVDIPLS